VANIQPVGRIAGTEENERQSRETGEGKTMKESGRERKGPQWPKAAGDVGDEEWWTSAVQPVIAC